MAQATRRSARTLTSSLEDYLEAVYDLCRQNRVARVRDMARRLEVGMPAVTAALKSLATRGLVHYDPYQFVTLSDRGEAAARDIRRRHDVLRQFLIGILGMSSQQGEANACRMEHAVDAEALDRLSRFVEFLQARGRQGRNCVDAFRRYFAAWRRADAAASTGASAPAGAAGAAGPAGAAARRQEG